MKRPRSGSQQLPPHSEKPFSSTRRRHDGVNMSFHSGSVAAAAAAGFDGEGGGGGGESGFCHSSSPRSFTTRVVNVSCSLGRRRCRPAVSQSSSQMSLSPPPLHLNIGDILMPPPPSSSLLPSPRASRPLRRRRFLVCHSRRISVSPLSAVVCLRYRKKREERACGRTLPLVAVVVLYPHVCMLGMLGGWEGTAAAATRSVVALLTPLPPRYHSMIAAARPM